MNPENLYNDHLSTLHFGPSWHELSATEQEVWAEKARALEPLPEPEEVEEELEEEPAEEVAAPENDEPSEETEEEPAETDEA